MGFKTLTSQAFLILFQQKHPENFLHKLVKWKHRQ